MQNIVEDGTQARDPVCDKNFLFESRLEKRNARGGGGRRRIVTLRSPPREKEASPNYWKRFGSAGALYVGQDRGGALMVHRVKGFRLWFVGRLSRGRE